MSKLMWILGILLAAAGLALGIMVFAAPASVVAWGINAEFAAIIFVGGILSIGLGGVINALETMPAPRIELPAFAAPAAPAAVIPEFGRRVAEPAAMATAAAADFAGEEVSEPVKETIAALEQARQKIERAFEPAPEAPEPAILAEATMAPPEPSPAAEPEPEPVAEAEPEPELPPEADEVIEAGQLYVVEERFIRQRPARILSDGTVEAETDEGWMRFENLEHLDEYLDAMAQGSGS